MELLPPLTVDGITYMPKGSPVLVWYPGGEVIEFVTLESARAELRQKQFEEWPGAHFARLYHCQDGRWNERPMQAG